MNVFELLDPRIRSVLGEMGIDRPTPPQSEAIPEVLRGRNVLIVAPTGTGKTEAAMLPLLHLILRGWSKSPGVKVLYITPLRALNRDILRRMVVLAERLGISVEVRHGDTPAKKRREIAEHPPDILITTPETFQALLTVRNFRPSLRGVRCVVIDEVHELVDSRRGAQLSLGLERLAEYLERDFQRVGLSATVGDLRTVAEAIFGVGRDYVVKSPPIYREMELTVDYTEYNRLVDRVLEISRGRGTILLFTNTRNVAETLASELGRALGEEARVHHSSISRSIREDVERSLVRGEVKIVIATSSLELGIDVGHIDVVIQYGSPRSATRLLQRVGRARHRYAMAARGIVLATTVEDAIEAAVIAARAARGELEKPVIHRKPLDVLAHQLAGFVLEYGRVPLARFLRLAARSPYFRDLRVDELMAVAEFMEKLGVVRIYEDGEIKVGPGRRTISYYYNNLSTIPDTVYVKAYDIASRREVGKLDLDYAERGLSEGHLIVLAGRAWEVVSINLEDGKIMLKPATSATRIPLWYGETIPVAREVAGEVSVFREMVARGLRPAGYPLSPNAWGEVERAIVEYVEKVGSLPTPKRLVIEQVGDVSILHSCFGTRINRALAMLTAIALQTRLRLPAYFLLDSCRIVFYGGAGVRGEAIEKALRVYLPELLGNMGYVEAYLRDTPAFQAKLLQAAIRFGVVPRGMRGRKGVSLRRLVEKLIGTPVDSEALRELEEIYMDMRGAVEVVRGVEGGDIDVRLVRLEEPSPLSIGIFTGWGAGRAVLKMMSTEAILRAVRERISNTEVLLICLYCGWHRRVKVRDVAERPRCPRCGSPMIAVAKAWDEEAEAVARKIGRRTVRGGKKLEELKVSAQLVRNYGRRAAEVLAGRGIGPSTAARILSRYAEDERRLYEEIVRAEVNFERSRRFWDKS